MGLKERRERERQARRESILSAARDLLHKKGINGASMNQIAKKAELGVATLYSYFTSKEELFFILQQEGLDHLKKFTSKNLKKKDDPKTKLKKIAFSFLEFSQKKKNYYYIINYFISTPEILFEQKLKDEIDGQAEQALSVAELVVKEGIDSKVFKDVDEKRISVMFWGMVHGLIQFKKLESTILSNDNYLEMFEYSVDYFIESLCPH